MSKVKRCFVRYRYRGEYEYAYAYSPISRMIIDPHRLPIGITVFTCVWKNDKLEARSRMIIKSQLPPYEFSAGPQRNDFYSEAELKTIRTNYGKIRS